MKDGRYTAFLKRCWSIDIEVNPKAADVFALAAVWCDGRAPLVLPKGVQARGLDRLQDALSQADHPLGHNILNHDLPIFLRCARRYQLMVQLILYGLLTS
ncbi:hypothetical protein [Ascidiaceihabitans sp.]|uniref:hypothetical protein n=1 Tax=Ascidiaceihabitans sp. TaxID=1872644 RepID=UPI0032995D62